MNQPASSTGAAGSAGHQVTEVFEDARNELGAKVADVKQAARHTVDEIKQTAHVAAGAVKDGYQALRADATTQASSLGDELRAYVRENPVKAVASAVLAGFVVGLLTRK